MKEVTMPKLSDTMTEGTVVAWRKGVGAKVERGEVLAEVETDKATMELEAFAGGVLLEIRVAAGKTVPVGTVIGIIGTAGEQPAVETTVAAGDNAEPAAGTPGTVSRAAARTPLEPEAASTPRPKLPVDGQPKAAMPTAAKPAPGADSEIAGKVAAAPVVRRRARDLGIDLAAVPGSGPGGRILLEDLEAMTVGNGATAGENGAQPGTVTALSEAQPLSRMRAAIARTVSESWRTIPHFSVTVEVRMDAAEQFRSRGSEDGAAVSLTALLVKVAVLALERHPRMNASLMEGGVVLHPDINIGIVVRRGDGLLVPVLRGCAGQSLEELASRAARLVDRARHGQLSDTELSGGTFAISNLGMYAIDAFVALVLPPMAAVLAVGAVRNGAVVEDGRLAVGRLMTLTLSADHRLVDGAYAAEFLRTVKQLLEEPVRLAGRETI
jgi:pyruvate dehydrogenase E2 component (dihydrolipoamide acetyltransferase)